MKMRRFEKSGAVNALYMAREYREQGMNAQEDEALTDAAWAMVQAVK